MGEDLSAWTLSFSAFQALLKHHLLIFADPPGAGFAASSTVLPNRVVHALVLQGLLIARRTVSIYSLNSSPAVTVFSFSWFSKCLPSSLAGPTRFLKEYISLMVFMISCSVHRNAITATAYSQRSVFTNMEPADVASRLHDPILENGLEQPQILVSLAVGGSCNQRYRVHEGECL